jgi:hypothetical protein
VIYILLGKYHSDEERLKAAMHAQPTNSFDGQIVTDPEANSPFTAAANRSAEHALS